jgi:hypothetical protein
VPTLRIPVFLMPATNCSWEGPMAFPIGARLDRHSGNGKAANSHALPDMAFDPY